MCAKPQREEDVPTAEPVTFEAAAIPPPPPPVTQVSFRNRVAVRIALMTASMAAMLCWVFTLGFVVWLPAAGFTAVHLYHRRTGQSLSTGAGARMGWLTGAFLFGITALLFIISVIAFATSETALAAVQQQMRSMPWGDAASAAQAVKMLQNPATLVLGLLCFLPFLFAVIMSFCAAGGALGAKILAK
jgi:hypothetical protein